MTPKQVLALGVILNIGMTVLFIILTGKPFIQSVSFYCAILFLIFFKLYNPKK